MRSHGFHEERIAPIFLSGNPGEPTKVAKNVVVSKSHDFSEENRVIYNTLSDETGVVTWFSSGNPAARASLGWVSRGKPGDYPGFD